MQENIVYLNCGEWYEDMIDHCSYTHNLISCEIKAWKILRPKRDRTHDRCTFDGYTTKPTVTSSKVNFWLFWTGVFKVFFSLCWSMTKVFLRSILKYAWGTLFVCFEVCVRYILGMLKSFFEVCSVCFKQCRWSFLLQYNQSLKCQWSIKPSHP